MPLRHQPQPANDARPRQGRQSQPLWLQITRHYYSEREREMPELLHELRQAETMLAAYVTVKLTPAQRAALLSLVIDLVGRHSAGRSSAPFKDSKLLAYLNQGFYQMAATEFMTYCYVFGRVDKRAWNKRNCEQNLFRSGRLVLEH